MKERATKDLMIALEKIVEVCKNVDWANGPLSENNPSKSVGHVWALAEFALENYKILVKEEE